MPYEVLTDKEQLGESPNKSRGAVLKEIKNLTSGAARGFIGETPPSMVTERIEKEKLSAEEKAVKSGLQNFLGRIIEPPTISSRTPPARAKQILHKKLSKMSLGELRRFWNKKTIPESVTDEEKSEIQGIWDDISP